MSGLRISSAQVHAAALAGMQRQQATLMRAQQELASGLKLLGPQDDPLGAGRALALDVAGARNSAFASAAGRSADALRLHESALAAATDVTQRVRELAVQGQSAALGDTDRRAIATELRALSEELRALANTRLPTGEYLYAGFSTATEPYVRTPAGVVYQGDAGTREQEVAPGLRVAVADPGNAVFRFADGNGQYAVAPGAGNTGSARLTGLGAGAGVFVPDVYTVTFAVAPDGAVSYSVVGASAGPVAGGPWQPGQAIGFGGVSLTLTGTPAGWDVYTVRPSAGRELIDTVDALADAFELPQADAAGTAAAANAATRALQDLDQGLTRLNTVRAQVGGRLGALDRALAQADDVNLALAAQRSDIRDVDYAQAITRLESSLAALQAVQASYRRTAQLSLFQTLA